MNRFLCILISCLLCLSCAACGSSSNQPEETPSPSSDVTNQSDSAASTSNSSLPMNLNEVYSCNINGVEGYVMVRDYQVVYDEMNEGATEVKTVLINAVFENAPEDLRVYASVFSLVEEAVKQSEGMWIVPSEFGEQVIFEYDNLRLSDSYHNGTYTAELLMSYMVPTGFEDFGFALTGTQSAAFDSGNKADIVNESTRWFTMGSLNEGILTYQGNALACAESDADMSIMQTYGFASQENKDYDAEDEFVEDEKKLVVIPEISVTKASSDGITLEFGKMEVLYYSEERCTVSVEIKYSGVSENDLIHCYLFDAYTDVHIDYQEYTHPSGNSVIFEFSHLPSKAPFTFSAGVVKDNGDFAGVNIHADVEFK